MTGARFPFPRAFFIVSYEHLSQKRPAKRSGAPAERFLTYILKVSQRLFTGRCRTLCGKNPFPLFPLLSLSLPQAGDGTIPFQNTHSSV